VARRRGFPSAAAMRRAFTARLGVVLKDYRERLQA
jgi:transcriptional regulator GlxA family with amidase domain